ncbi:erythromycin esterase [Streptomyces rimosus subsp. pseudoverticillatus]|uniref:erythromycin esterase family protein n=1 Tax=Streptomyces rimosus TaxID=1927 RepID=UPI0006B2A5BE|nr:erythromycin esterase family protein [Streptomyces rimosus]KOT97197.1 erythromycin esterase [Streptomyces rimosus subsp. pseudoverticillatus]
MTTTAVAAWVRDHAHPLTTAGPGAPADDLAPLDGLVRGARVVAVGASTRLSHELAGVSHRILRFLVERHGFRSLALEGDDAVRAGLDAYVRTGAGDPRAMLAQARPFWRIEEIADAVEWMRAYNVAHPDDPVRFAGAPEGQQVPQGPGGLADIERVLAEDTIRWQQHTGGKVVYWGGLAHTVKGDPRTVSPSSPPATHRNAGGYLREHYGSGYVSIGLTFHHGSAPMAVPAPPEEFAEATLGRSGLPDAYLWNLRAPSPAAVREWLTAPVRTRLVGPRYDVRDDAAHHLSGGSLADWFDALVHVRTVSSARFL